jgi:hypothetical protein
VWNGRQPGTQLVELSVDKSSARAAVTRGPECKKVKNLHRWSHCQEEGSGDCNKLRTLVCVCQWSVKCSSEWYIQGVNKSSSQIHSSSIVTHTFTWQHHAIYAICTLDKGQAYSWKTNPSACQRECSMGYDCKSSFARTHTRTHTHMHTHTIFCQMIIERLFHDWHCQILIVSSCTIGSFSRRAQLHESDYISSL